MVFVFLFIPVSNFNKHVKNLMQWQNNSSMKIKISFRCRPGLRSAVLVGLCDYGVRGVCERD